MKYTKSKSAAQRSYGVHIVEAIGYSFYIEAEETNAEISEIIFEVIEMDRVPGLMTWKALCRHMKAPPCVADRMKRMEIGSSFIYEEMLISRISNHMYNAKLYEMAYEDFDET